MYQTKQNVPYQTCQIKPIKPNLKNMFELYGVPLSEEYIPLLWILLTVLWILSVLCQWNRHELYFHHQISKCRANYLSGRHGAVMKSNGHFHMDFNKIDVSIIPNSEQGQKRQGRQCCATACVWPTSFVKTEPTKLNLPVRNTQKQHNQCTKIKAQAYLVNYTMLVNQRKHTPIKSWQA